MENLFKNARALESKIEIFFQNITEAALYFKAGITDYLNDELDGFENRLHTIYESESKADDLRRDIRYNLYTRMLIPESRGDVLGLLETSDSVVDDLKVVSARIDIERPDFRDYLRPGVQKLVEACVEAISSLSTASMAYFKNNSLIQDYIHKVHFYEHEADSIEEDLKRQIFRGEDIPRLSEKMQLRDIVSAVAGISDKAQDVAERLSVNAIKRSI